MFSHSFTSHSKEGKSQSQLGFGMVEMLVSISIIVIVSSVILVRQNSFNSAILLRSQAYEVALQVRDVQLSAVSVSADGGGFRSVVGVHFDSSTGNNTSYRIFSDSDGDNFYDSNEEFGIQGLLDPRFEISGIRTIGDSFAASDGLSVVFIRPDFDAEFTDRVGTVNASSVEIDIARRDASGGPAAVRTVEITSTGQISVQ